MNRLRFLTVILLFTMPLLRAHTSWQNELSSSVPGPHTLLSTISMDLKVSWEGMINAGTLHIDFAPANANKPGSYVIRSTAKSLGAAALLFPYKSSFWSEIDATTLQPRYFYSVETDKKEEVTTTVKHSNAGVDCHEVSKLFKTGAITTADPFFKYPQVFDIFSAMLQVRSQKLNTGDRIKLVVCPFKTPYLLHVNVAGREVHEGRNTIRINVGMQKINRDTLELLPYKKLKKDATLWLSDDADRIPVEFRAAVFIGDVRATLTQIKKE
jgi:hypothetical protein